MLSHLTAFIFYTFAMVGILLFAFVIYKKFNFSTKQENRGMIHIVDSCPIGAKKTLLIVKIGNEKFLIASGLEHTTFLAKLNDDEIKQLVQTPTENEIKKERALQIPKQKEEKDIYDFLYSQSKKLENQKPDMSTEPYNTQKTFNNNQNRLRELYTSNPTPKLNPKTNSTLESRKKLMQELLNEIHQSKNTNLAKTESRF